MQITLFKALKTLDLTDDQATQIVEAMEEYIALKITEATKGMEAQLKAQTWLLGFIGTILAIGAIIAGWSHI
ncbi:hypothetical protein [Erythrobacter sp. MTPC3]|jgi:hypothetical protein|uniref:hypothetical protein n=1 Tax=Erythrobacter sp. MTPC3 TaxID=3056564 RepID=UPI0036F31CDA|tara:strand:- start:466 stop:681 length:216 start_codon:yes stop_codon:yes gene_type:complete